MSIESFVLLFLEVKLAIEGLILTSGILGVGLIDEDNIGEGDDITAGEGDDITGEGEDITGDGEDITGEGEDITGEGDDIIEEGSLFVIFFPTFSDT
jgi:hypothetical protein